MNKQGRKNIAKAVQLLEEAKSIIDSEMTDEETKFDNLSEGLQNSEVGERLSENKDNLDNAISSIDDAIDYCNEAAQ